MEHLNHTLEQYWGYTTFRPAQVPIVESIYSGKDTLAILPTGGGKSLCFQVPAICHEGITLVITPLISLMEDQVQSLKQKGVRAECLHSSMDRTRQEAIESNAGLAKYDLLYLSPERLVSSRFKSILANLPLAMLVVDEAHCISQWGHDFRPAYLRIAEIREYFPKIQIVALTATATQKVQDDILASLALTNAQIHRASVERPNIHYSVTYSEDRYGQLLTLCEKYNNRSGIIYVRSRKGTQKITQLLVDKGISAAPYHAGLKALTKQKTQTAWLKGEIQIVVATNAFGMGIDKPDVRFVLHYESPPSLEDYVQEAGRAGRDGEEAHAVIVFHEGDKSKKQKQLEQRFPPKSVVKEVYTKLCNTYSIAPGHGPGHAYIFDLRSFALQHDISLDQVYFSLKILIQAGYIHITENYHRPSRVWVYPDTYRQFLNEQDKDSLEVKLLTKLLRVYDGIYYDYTRIYEQQLMQSLTDSIDDVKKALRRLHTYEIIAYQEENDKSFLTFIYKRPDFDKLTLPKSAYEHRRTVMEDHMSSILDYCVSEECRQQLMNQYFGFDVQPCGVCDNCQRQHPISEVRVSEELTRRIQSQTTTLQNILQGWQVNEIDLVKSILKEWESEKVITIHNNTITFSE